MIGPTDGNLYYLRQREIEEEEYMARFVECPTCNGTGEVYVEIGIVIGDPEVDDWDEETCPDCNGSGEIESEEEE